MGRALWIPERLRAFGVTVVEHDGWKQRGGSGLDPHAVVIHHTAAGPAGDAPSLHVCINGRPDLPGPLCHVLLARSGIAHVIAAGRANHAGSGGWRGVRGNTHALGIEAENTGVGEPWPPVQLEAFRRCSAALLAGIGRDASWLCSHREWTPRKVDPAGIDMDRFRADVARLLATPSPGPQEDDVTPEQLQQAVQAALEAPQPAFDGNSVIGLLDEVNERQKRQGADLGTLKTTTGAIQTAVAELGKKAK